MTNLEKYTALFGLIFFIWKSKFPNETKPAVVHQMLLTPTQPVKGEDLTTEEREELSELLKTEEKNEDKLTVQKEFLEDLAKSKRNSKRMKALYYLMEFIIMSMVLGASIWAVMGSKQTLLSRTKIAGIMFILYGVCNLFVMIPNDKITSFKAPAHLEYKEYAEKATKSQREKVDKHNEGIAEKIAPLLAVHKYHRDPLITQVLFQSLIWILIGVLHILVGFGKCGDRPLRRRRQRPAGAEPAPAAPEQASPAPGSVKAASKASTPKPVVNDPFAPSEGQVAIAVSTEK